MLQNHAVPTAAPVGQVGSRSDPSWIHLRSGGVSLLLAVPTSGLPVVRHWGADLGRLDGPAAAASLSALLGDDGGLPPASLTGTHEGLIPEPVFGEVRVRLVDQPALRPGLTEGGPDTVVVEAEDPAAGLCLDLAIQLTAAGIVRGRAGLTNRAAERYRLEGLSLLLPAGVAATHSLELDTLPVRAVPLRPGALAAPGETGRPGQVVVAEPGSGFRRGEVWHGHVAFSGTVTHRVEVPAGGPVHLGGGERLAPGEVVLARDEAYHSPWVLWAWGDGLDAAAARLHAELRTAEPAAVPVIFDAGAPVFAGHDRAAMLELAEYAAAVGVETFLLDVGWCVRAGLDPFADHETRGATATPDDLAGLLERVRELDLEVGLAVDLERLDPESSIARDHPEWLRTGERDEVEPMLDLSVRSAMGYVWERLTKLLDRHPVSLLAWSPAVTPSRRHASTLAAYRLIDALRERYPEMLIVSRALDAAMARRAVTADGMADSRQRHTGFAALTQLLPPERCWQPAYDEPEEGLAPGYRAAAAFFGALGMGLDLRRQAPGSLRAIHRWLELHKGFRPLLHTGRTVRSDTDDAGFSVHGVVAEDRVEALFALVWLDHSEPRRIRLDGLDPAATYRLEIAGPRPADAQAVTPEWPGGDDAPRLTGQALGTVGIALPAARRGSALMLHLTAV